MTNLREIVQRHEGDDCGIEQLQGLQRVTIAEATKYYSGHADDAEAALAYVIYLANKGLAHTVSSFTKHDRGTSLLEIAFRGVPELICNRFYIARGITPPEYKLQSRAHTV